MKFPVRIELNKKNLIISWDDGRNINYPLKFLRDESPDARNKGETILWRRYESTLKNGGDSSGKYEIDSIENIGAYAIKIKWKDGYDFGLYSWELLWRLGEYLEIKEKLKNKY